MLSRRGQRAVSKQRNGGRIEVTSEVNKGSTFRIILPRTGLPTPVTFEIDPRLERRTSGQLRSTEPGP